MARFPWDWKIYHFLVRSFEKDASFSTEIATPILIPIVCISLVPSEILDLENNEITGTVPQELCDRRGGGFMELQALTVDCLGESPEVSCQCCTNCPLDI